MEIRHHGAKDGVTGSCHQLVLGKDSLLIDCGLFQGAEAKSSLDIEFEVKNIAALLLTHAHIDHIGRLPWLLAAGFSGPIFATEATAALVPLMIEDGLKVQLGLNHQQCKQITDLLKTRLRPIPYQVWAEIYLKSGDKIRIRFQPAGHILGSAYIEVQLPSQEIVVFSGDLGPKNTPLLTDPIPPKFAHTVVIESTYGDQKSHPIQERQAVLRQLIERSLQDGGTILIPAFSVGRTQELLFDLENILAQVLSFSSKHRAEYQWQNLPIIIDSPLAQKITEQYRSFHQLWSQEAKLRRTQGRHPLAFEQCVMIDSHAEHMGLVNRLQQSGEPAIVIAASGMCTGGRIMNYLKALLADQRTDIIFAGYQASGTLGRALIEGEKNVTIDAEKISVQAQIYQMSGYSAHAAQEDLVSFIAGIEKGPEVIRIVHGDHAAQTALANALQTIKPNANIIIAAQESDSKIDSMAV